MPSSAKLFVLSMDHSPAHFEVLSTNTLFDLVSGGFDVCNPRPGEDATEHLWNITLRKSGKKFMYYGPLSPEEFCGPYDEVLPDASATKLASIGTALKDGMQLLLEYDYGTTTQHTFTVLSSTTIRNPRLKDFPRRKKMHPPNTVREFETVMVDLDAEFAALDCWINEQEGATEVNLFQAGRKQNYGYLENEDVSMGRMIYLADKPASLNHYLKCLNAGAGVHASGGYNWHSVVVLPSGSKKISKYSEDLQPGFVDAVVVPSEDDGIPDLATIFPKVAALAGFRKDKKVKKGWIRYKNETLIIATGAGGSSTRPGAPKGTAYDGTGFHIPDPSDEILLSRHLNIGSLHELFCFVEGFLQS